MRPKLSRRIFPLVIFSLSILTLRAQKIGVELYSLREQFKTDIPGTLALLKSWQVSEIEGGGTYGLPMEEYKKLLADNGLKMVSIGVNFDDLDTNITAAIEEAKAFGAKYIVCFWITHHGDDFTIADAKHAAEVFNKAGRRIHDSGLTFCYHTHGYEFRPYEGGTLFDYIVNHTDPKYVAYEMDVFWVKHPGQDPVALLQKYPHRFLLLHLKDRRPGTEGNQDGRADDDTNVVLGQGDVNIAAVMKEAKKIGIRHYFIEDESSRSVQQIPQSLQFLHQLK